MTVARLRRRLPRLYAHECCVFSFPPVAGAPTMAPGSSSSILEQVKTWADVVSDPSNDLEFIMDLVLAVVDGVLHIPQSIVDLGVAKLKAALIAQLAGPAPPLRVFHLMATRLWGYEGPIQISLLFEGFYLLEFPSVELSS
ncbi:hypothetical protein LINGRAHAP2_LOCUS20306 [Linum grandiflorum]